MTRSIRVLCAAGLAAAAVSCQLPQMAGVSGPAAPASDGAAAPRVMVDAGRNQAVITAETIASTFVTPAPEGRTYGAHVGDAPGTVISPAFARYHWDGEIGYGGLERSALRSAITIPGRNS